MPTDNKQYLPYSLHIRYNAQNLKQLWLIVGTKSVLICELVITAKQKVVVKFGNGKSIIASKLEEINPKILDAITKEVSSYRENMEDCSSITKIEELFTSLARKVNR